MNKDPSNLNFDYLQRAIAYNNVIREIIANDPRPLDQVEAMMFQWMINYLRKKRESLLAQGLNGINPGHGEGQANPLDLLEQLKES